MIKKPIQQLVLASLFLGFAIILPSYVGQIPEIGRRLLPMHIPILLCGYFCGWKYGLLTGLIAPILRSLLFTMPPMYPVAIAMSFELATYGLTTALVYALLNKKKYSIFVSLVSAMILGRVVYGFASYVLFMIDGNLYTLNLFITSTVVDAIPGIILQIIFIPAIVLSLNRYTHLDKPYGN